MNIWILLLLYFITVVISFAIQIHFFILLLNHFIKSGYILDFNRVEEIPKNNLVKYITFVPILNILFIVLFINMTLKKIEEIDMAMSYFLVDLTIEEKEKYTNNPSVLTIMEIISGRIRNNN